MKNNLPRKIHQNECGIVNLDNSDGPGTHWVAYRKQNIQVIYFDSYGNLPPPKEIISYCGPHCTVQYNHKSYQKYDSVICGHLCLSFLCTQT